MIFIVRQLVEVTPCQSGVHEIDSRNVLPTSIYSTIGT